MLCRGRKRDVQRYKTQIRTRTTIVLLIKLFDWMLSGCRCRSILKPVSVLVCREDSRMRMLFLQNLVDDRSESVMSYYEFLVHLQKQISKWACYRWPWYGWLFRQCGQWDMGLSHEPQILRVTKIPRGSFKEMLSWETEITSEYYHERISSRDFSHRSHNKRVKGWNRER